MVDLERVLDYYNQVLKVGQVIVAFDYRDHYKVLQVMVLPQIFSAL